MHAQTRRRRLLWRIGSRLSRRGGEESNSGAWYEHHERVFETEIARGGGSDFFFRARARGADGGVEIAFVQGRDSESRGLLFRGFCFLVLGCCSWGLIALLRGGVVAGYCVKVGFVLRWNAGLLGAVVDQDLLLRMGRAVRL